MLTMFGAANRVLVDVFSHFNGDDGWAMASHVAMSIILALFPFLIFATALAGFLGNEDLAQDMVALVFETWPDQVAKPIADEIDALLKAPHASFLTLGIALALLFASNGVEAIRVALNRAYRTRDDRSFLFCRLQSVFFVIAGASILLFVSFILFVAPLFSNWVEGAIPLIHQREPSYWYVRPGLAIAALAFLLFACHAWLPAGRRPVTELWPGIVGTLTIWIATGAIFASYLERYADYGSTYAGLAGVMTALIFLYLMAVILILGGELNAAILQFRKRDKT